MAPPKTAKTRKRRGHKKRAKAARSAPDTPPPTTTDPTIVTQPARGVHQKLRHAWAIQPGHDVCFVFDAIDPSRQWKLGTEYTEEDPFAEYGPAPWPDMTDTDDHNVLQPYFPISHMWVFFFPHCPRTAV